MAKIAETCSCGASFSYENADQGTILSAVESWRTGHRHAAKDSEEFHPAGGNVAATERKYDTTPHELDGEAHRSPYGRKAGF